MYPVLLAEWPNLPGQTDGVAVISTEEAAAVFPAPGPTSALLWYLESTRDIFPPVAGCSIIRHTNKLMPSERRHVDVNPADFLEDPRFTSLPLENVIIRFIPNILRVEKGAKIYTV